ncbi:PAS domain-containing protein [Halovenus sp. HT40]|uniref:PAS domain-containing protein n=1 Tax=Halovenus sp. HT40 TaxID=3126691 RepID=UPI00300ECDC9
MLQRDPDELFEICPDGVAILDTEAGSVCRTNQQCANLCGRSSEALADESVEALTPDGWCPRTPLATLIERSQNQPVTFDWQIERPDGTVVDLRCSMRRLRDPDGRALVTVREHPGATPAYETTARSERELRDLLEGMNDAVMVVDFDGEFVDVNREALDRLGYTREELLSMGVSDVAPPEHAAQVDDRLQRIDEQETLVFETVQITADGEAIPVEINASRVSYCGQPAVLSVARDISDRKERQRRLRTLEQAVEQTAHGVYITDIDGTIEYVNSAFEEITGYSESEALGRDPSILKSGARGDEYYAELWDSLLAGDTWIEEVQNERADGKRYYAEQTIAPIVEDGEVVKFVAVQQDVTDRKRREAELQRYRQLIENVPVGVYRNEPGQTGTFEEVNPAMVELFDADSKDDLIGLPVAELYPDPQQREQFSQTLDQAGRVVDKELRLETLDGSELWASVSAIKHETDDGTYYDGIIQDVTDRREAQKQLERREKRFRRLFEDHSAPMLLIDPDSGDIEHANEAAAEFYGYDESALTSLSIQEINQISNEEIARRREEADTQEENRFIFPHALADGEIRQVEVDSSPIHAGGKRVLFSIIHDVTERESNRRTLERQNEQLEVLNRVVRHDIRNDMTVVLSYADLLAEYVEGEGEEYLDTVVEHTHHAVELTRTVRELMEAMLDEDTTEAGKITLSRCLDAEIEDARSGYTDAEFIVDGSLPDVRVIGNEMLSSVFRNLLSNAAQHNDKPTPEVTVTATERTDDVVVRVADNGPGIPDAQKESIFGKGERGMESSGTGLGLYLVHTFIDQFGGEVWVSDNDPEGAVFHVALPKAD